MLSCPSAATLAGLGNDSIEATIGTALEQHIEGCPACRAKLDRLAHNDAGSGATMSLPCPDDPPEIPGFVIERELGRGSMSVVYQARQPSLGRRVALKVVRSGPGAGSGEYARWLREARAFSLVRHDNVVRLYQVGEANGWLYLVLELVRGGTLNGRLDVPYPARDAARLLETIAGAVAAIHGAGLLHRDLKPSNILLDAGPETPREQATPRVGDFGLAYAWDDPEATVIANGPTGPVGTPRYMAPEQVTGDRAAIGPAADIYGLGALFYHLLTGRPPFKAPSVAETLEQVLHQEPVSPRWLNPAIPRDLETICLKCLEKDPGRRYHSADALGDDLRLCREGRPIAARPVSLPEKTWRACRRRPAVAVLASALVFTLCAGFLGMVRLWRHAEAERVRAEADKRITREILGEMVELNVGTSYLPAGIDPQRHLANLRRARRRLLDLPRQAADELTNARWLARVDSRLGHRLTQEGDWDGARSAFEESLVLWDRIIRQEPDDFGARAERIRDLRGLASLVEQAGDPGASVILMGRAVNTAEELMRLRPDANSIDTLAGVRSFLIGGGRCAVAARYCRRHPRRTP